MFCFRIMPLIRYGSKYLESKDLYSYFLKKNIMKFMPHVTFGIFTGLLVYYLTSDWILGLIALLFQIGLILDFICKKLINFEPLHTFLAMAIISSIMYLIVPVWGLITLLAYFSHLILDMFVDEEIYQLAPFSMKRVQWPKKNSEMITAIGSTIGSLIMVILILI